MLEKCLIDWRRERRCRVHTYARESIANMNIHLGVFLLLVVGMLFKSTEGGSKMDLEGLKDMLKPMSKSCKTKTGVSDAMVAGTKDGLFPKDKPLMCFFKCLSVMLKAMNKKGEFTLRDLNKQIDLLMLEELAPRMKEVVKKCVDRDVSAMESYTSDSSDSDSASKTVDLSYLQLDSQVLHEHFICTTSPEHVETLLLQQNRLSYLPDSVVMFSNLATLDVSNCGLQRLPDYLSELSQLVCLSAKNNGLNNDSLPKSLERLPNLRELNLSGNRLTEFPEQVLDLPGLRYLYLGGNQISEITKDVWKIQSLQVLSMGGNRLTEVPSTLGQLTALQALVLCDNRLESLPSSIANLKNLKSLLLHKNGLKTLPTEIITLRNLTELSLRDNPLVVRFVSDMTHNPPSLLELAARVIKVNEIPYKEEDLPRTLLNYLDSAHHCVNPRCAGVFFDNRVEHVKFVDFCGKYRLPLLQYLCSSKCIGPREGNEEVVSGAMIRKVLLG